MNRIRPGEWLATFGFDRLLLLCVIYVFSLGPALVVGSSVQLRSTGMFAVALWTGGALVITLLAGQSISRFRMDAGELRLPGYRGALVRSYAGLLGLTLALPFLMFWILVPAGRYWIGITLITPLGLLRPKLPDRLHFHGRSRAVSGIDAQGPPVRTPSEIIRMFVGRAYASVPIRSRAFAVRTLFVALWSVPLGIMLRATELTWSVVYLSLTGIIGWMWFLNSLAPFVRNRSGSFSELALLPGLGDASTQRRGLYRAVLAPPLVSLACLIGVGLLMAHFAGWSADGLVRVGIGCALQLMYCAVGVLQLLLMKRAVTRVALLLPSLMPLILAPSVFRIGADLGRSPNAVLERLLVLSALLLTGVPIFLIWIYIRSLSRRPHPFSGHCDSA